MIVQPNFPDHWKTKRLESCLGDDPLAPVYVLRMWGHCQEQKTHRFQNLSPADFAAICRFKGDAERLWQAMADAKFIRVKGGALVVHQWDEYNAGLITSWRNGRKGGRKKKPAENPQVSCGKPEQSPAKTYRGDEKVKMGGGGGRAETTTDDEWISSLGTKHSAVDIRHELEMARKHCEKNGRGGKFDRDWFERDWLPKCSPTVQVSRKGIRPKDDDGPDNWRDVLQQLYPDNLINPEGRPWKLVPDSTKEQVIQACKSRAA